MIRTILTFRVSHEDARAVEQIYVRNDVLGYSLEQTRGEVSELAVSVDGDAGDGLVEVVVTAVWPDEAAYQEWLDHPERGSVAAGLPEIVGSVGAARRYEVRQLATAASTSAAGRHIERNLDVTPRNPDGNP